MQSIYDFPDVYDAVLRSSAEQIKTEVNSIRRLLEDQGHNQRQRPRTRLWDMWTWNSSCSRWLFRYRHRHQSKYA